MDPPWVFWPQFFSVSRQDASTATYRVVFDYRHHEDAAVLMQVLLLYGILVLCLYLHMMRVRSPTSRLLLAGGAQGAVMDDAVARHVYLDTKHYEHIKSEITAT